MRSKDSGEPTRCHWVYEKALACFIPGCMGGAVGGPEGCTCNTPLSEIEQALKSRDAALDYAGELNAKAWRRKKYVEGLVLTEHRLRIEIRRLRTMAGE